MKLSKKQTAYLNEQRDIAWQTGFTRGKSEGYITGRDEGRKEFATSREHSRFEMLKEILRTASTAAESATRAMMSYEKQL